MILKVSKEIGADDLASYVEAISLYRKEHSEELDPEVLSAIDNLPGRYYLTSLMTDDEREIIQTTIDSLWKRVTGTHIAESNTAKTSQQVFLDGCYWLVPGGVMLAGINHYSIIAKNKGIFCSLLGLNPLVVEQKLAKAPEDLILYIMLHGAARMLVSREENKVVCQTTEAAWPWVRDKLAKMYHKTKVAKVLDLTVPFKGWESGVPVRVH